MLHLNPQWIFHILWIVKAYVFVGWVLQGLATEPKSIDITEASYQVAVEVRGKVQCGGSIVNHLWIITAASCLYNLSVAPTDVQIRAGTSRKLYKGSFHWVSKVIIQPQFSGRSNDIALIELATPLKFKRGIQPITLASRSPTPKYKGRITGWGTLNNVTTDYTKDSSVLCQTHVTIMNKTDCQDLFGNNLTCVNDEGKFSVCDSGGPLIIGRQLVGLAVDCHRPYLGYNISAFTDVSHYKKWIIQTVYKFY